MSVATRPAGDAAHRRRRARTHAVGHGPGLPLDPRRPAHVPGEVSQHYGDTVSFPVPGSPGAAAQRPGRRPARAPDLGAQLGQGHRPVRRPGARHRSRPARLGRAELDRPPTARRPRLPPPAPGGGRRRGARGRPTAVAARLGGRAPTRWATCRRRRRPDAPHRPRRRRPRALPHRPVRAGPAAAGATSEAGGPGGAARPIDPAPGRVDPDPDQPAAALRRVADSTTARPRSSPSGGPATPAPADTRTVTTSSACCSTAAWTDGEIRDELVTMVIAGHETVAAALAWTLMLLAEHPAARTACAPSSTPTGPGAADRAPRGACRGRERSSTRRCASIRRRGRISRRSHGRRRGRRAAGPGRHAGHHQPLAGPPACPTSWPEPEAFRPERFLDGHRPLRLPAVRAGAAAVHRSGVRARRDGLVLSRAAARAPHRRARRPGDWTRPVAEAKVAVHPRGGMPLDRTRDGHAVTAALIVDLALASAARRSGGVGAAGWWPTSAPSRATSRRAARSRRCRCPWSSRRVTRSRPCRRCCGRWPSSCRRSPRSSWWTTVARRDRRRGPSGRRHRVVPARHATARLDRQGLGLPHRRRRRRAGDLLLFLDADTVLRPGALAGLLDRARPGPRRARVGAAATTTSCGPTSSCRPTSTWSR